MTPEDKEEAFLRQKDLEEERQNKIKNRSERKNDFLEKTSLVEKPGQERHDSYRGPHLNSDSEEMNNYLNGLVSSDPNLRDGSPDAFVKKAPSLFRRITGFFSSHCTATATAVAAVAALAGFAVYKSR